MHKRFAQLGFTLIELLVVISIIAILMALGTASYTTAQKKGRDAKREADMKSLQSAMEQYNSLHGAYPTDSNCAATDIEEVLPAGFPTDPKTGNDYYRACEATGSTYCICGELDQADTGNSMDSACNFGTGTGADYYCVTNLQ